LNSATALWKLVNHKHKRVLIKDASPARFGMCEQHPHKENEYYDKLTSKAHCSICAIAMAQGQVNSEKGNLITLEHAYKQAKSQTQQQTDDISERRKTMIKNEMERIQADIQTIKTQAQNAQERISEIVEEALKELFKKVQVKINALKADRLELARQFGEIRFMNDYL